MESIGELSQRTGVSRRMLRYWEAHGLLTPVEVVPGTRERRYAPSQSGRVQLIATLRTVGFGVRAIRDLLDRGLTDTELEQVLRRRELELTESIARDSTALAAIQARLSAMEMERRTMAGELSLTGLPDLELHGVSNAVRDETEIPEAVARLLQRLDADVADRSQDVHLCYDGTRDDTLIRVTAAVREPVEGARPVTFPGAEVAAVVRLGERPVDTGDAWLVLDTELRRQGLAAVGPYRQTFHTDGSVTLAVPVSSAPPCADPEVDG
ncbi:MerR family transcriptional regulator [Kocuria marina]|uniref:MerR family transcriptional regulator n=1 Tax=Kocuria marina TaxID=223184 RepID=UPI0022E8CCFC|nr:MerR family transcriptional regulator [Kocuria marina]